LFKSKESNPDFKPHARHQFYCGHAYYKTIHDYMLAHNFTHFEVTKKKWTYASLYGDTDKELKSHDLHFENCCKEGNGTP
jgi:hypothetical protein